MISIGQHRSCNTERAIYRDRHHVCQHQPRPYNFLGTLGQFCAAFYHVPTRNSGPYYCLDPSECNIGRRIRSIGDGSQPRTVVAATKCQDKDGAVVYEARYSNCYDDKMHAEDFFRLDVERGDLRLLINDNKVSTITLYLTFQPCHLTDVVSKGGSREEHSCSDTLLTLFRDRQFSTRRNDIELFIKLTHVYKVDWKTAPVDEERNNAIWHAAQGIRMLMREGILVTRMDESDWEYLLGMVECEERPVPAYWGSIRETLDIEIGYILRNLRVEAVLDQDLPHKCADNGFGVYDHHKHILKRHDAPDGNFLGNAGQICAAFYHIFDGQRIASSCQRGHCLDCHSCLVSRKKRISKGLFDPPKAMVAVLKCEGFDGAVLYEVRYTDCCGFGVTAEDFFELDAKSGDLRAVIDSGHVRKVTIYASWPPRYKSPLETWNSLNHCSCTTLAHVYINLLKSRNIELLIKLSHVYKEGWLQNDENVRAGIKVLIESGILVTGMEYVDWKYLQDVAVIGGTSTYCDAVQSCSSECSPFRFFEPDMDTEPRRVLDEQIRVFLFQLTQEVEQKCASSL